VNESAKGLKRRRRLQPQKNMFLEVKEVKLTDIDSDVPNENRLNAIQLLGKSRMCSKWGFKG
jgi:hypothetical protein